MSSESAKIKKSSPEPARVYEFQPFRTAGSRSFERTEDPPARGFRLANSFKAAVAENPALRDVLEEEVTRRLEERLKTENAAILERVSAEAREQGYRAGFEEGKARLGEALDSLERIGREIRAEESRILADHESDWCRALERLLWKLGVENKPGFLPEMRQWLRDSLGAVESESELLVRLSPADRDRLRDVPSEKLSGLVLEADASLSPGEIHCRSAAGELMFSRETSLRALSAVIDKYYPESKTIEPEKSTD